MTELVQPYSGQEFMIIRTDDVQAVGDSLVKNGAVRLGKNIAETSKGIFFIVQGQLVLVTTMDEY